jgi:hypothetical protein
LLLTGIERAGLWAYFHKDWLLQLRSLIRPQLPPEYRIFVESEAILIAPGASTVTATVLPDVAVARGKAAGSTPARGAMAATAALIEVEEECETFTKYWLLIRRAPENLVVASLEILSPSNKGLGNRFDRDNHLRKRESLLDAGVSVMEVDALLSGQRLLPAALSDLARFERNAWMAFHRDGRRKFRGWGWNEPDPPPIATWVVEGDLEVLADLPLALEQAREFNRWDSFVEVS